MTYNIDSTKVPTPLFNNIRNAKNVFEINRYQYVFIIALDGYQLFYDSFGVGPYVLLRFLVVFNVYHIVWIIVVAVANNFMLASMDFIDVCALVKTHFVRIISAIM